MSMVRKLAVGLLGTAVAAGMVGAAPSAARAATPAEQLAADVAAQCVILCTLSATASGEVVTVTGAAAVSSPITLAIPQGVTLEWRATLGATAKGTLLSVSGPGKLLIGDSKQEGSPGLAASVDGSTAIVSAGAPVQFDGGSLTVAGTAIKANGQVPVTISGGSIMVDGAAGATGVASDGPVAMTGGELAATGGEATAFASSPGGVAITGGTVNAANGKLFARNGSDPKLVIDGDILVVAESGQTLADVTLVRGMVRAGSNRTVAGAYTMSADLANYGVLAVLPKATLSVPHEMFLDNYGALSNQGTILVDGQLTNGGAIDTSGKITVTDTGTWVDYGTITGSGKIVVAGKQVYPAPNPITAAPQIKKPNSDTVTPGTVLSVKGVPAGWTAKYQWRRAGKAIAKATAKTYKVRKADQGHNLTVKTTLSKAGYVSKSFVSDPLAVKAKTASFTPKAKGTAKQGKTLKAAGLPKGWKATKYRWLRDGKAIAKATKASYKLTAADVSHKISVRVTVGKSGRTATTKTSAARSVSK
ncbi:MAG: hypothetical protein LBR32_09235 [Propionibacteriaceae bacterium]|jgi:hypothetical protein|nr:hypothetical protein [Propionibacteriaceae bacterium]